MGVPEYLYSIMDVYSARRQLNSAPGLDANTVSQMAEENVRSVR